MADADLRFEDEKGRGLGVYPEIKHPAYFADLDLDLEPRVAHELAEAGYRERSDLAWEIGRASCRERV